MRERRVLKQAGELMDWYFVPKLSEFPTARSRMSFPKSSASSPISYEPSRAPRRPRAKHTSGVNVGTTHAPSVTVLTTFSPSHARIEFRTLNALRGTTRVVPRIRSA